MTTTPEENALSEMHLDKIRSLADEHVFANPALMINGAESYEEWLEETGLDDSFVGNDIDTFGSEDLYEAALRIEDNTPEDMPSM